MYTLEEKKALSKQKEEFIPAEYSLEQKREWEVKDKSDKPWESDSQKFVGKKILRGTLNSYRIHILNAFEIEYSETPFLAEQQKMIDDGILTPKISVDSSEEMLTKYAFLMKHMEGIIETFGSKNRVVVLLNTPTFAILDKVVQVAKEFGINIRWELAGKDEVLTQSNIDHWDRALLATERRFERGME